MKQAVPFGAALRPIQIKWQQFSSRLNRYDKIIMYGEKMKTGKASEAVLKRSILKQLDSRRRDVVLGAEAGENFSAVSGSEDETIVLSIDPITGATERIGSLGIWAAVNDVAASGAEPAAVLVTLLLPTVMNEVQLKLIVKDMEAAAQKANVQIIGGHTEVTRAVNRPVITVAGIGKCQRDAMLFSKSVRPGMDILITNWIGIEGTIILAAEKEEALLKHFSRPFVEKAKALEEYLPVLLAASIAAKNGARAMHHMSEGGVFGALWEMAEASHVGLDIDLKKIPIRQETIEICEFFGINPYKLISGGSLLIAAEDGEAVVSALKKEGCHAVIIGKAAEGNDRILRCGEEARYLETPQTDELHRIL